MSGNDTKFIPGLIAKAPHERAPEYVKGKLSIKNAELLAYLQERIAAGEEWTNVDIKVSQNGKWYAAQDDWKPNSGERSERPQRTEAKPAPAGDVFPDDDIPF